MRSEQIAAMLRQPPRHSWVPICIRRDKEWYAANGGPVTDAEMTAFRGMVTGMIMEFAPKQMDPGFWTQPANFNQFDLSYTHPMTVAVIEACRAHRSNARRGTSAGVETSSAS